MVLFLWQCSWPELVLTSHCNKCCLEAVKLFHNPLVKLSEINESVLLSFTPDNWMSPSFLHFPESLAVFKDISNTFLFCLDPLPFSWCRLGFDLLRTWTLSTNKLIKGFPHSSLAKIKGHPTRSSIKKIINETQANCGNIHCPHGGGMNGHIGITMTVPENQNHFTCPMGNSSASRTTSKPSQCGSNSTLQCWHHLPEQPWSVHGLHQHANSLWKIAL